MVFWVFFFLFWGCLWNFNVPVKILLCCVLRFLACTNDNPEWFVSISTRHAASLGGEEEGGGGVSAQVPDAALCTCTSSDHAQFHWAESRRHVVTCFYVKLALRFPWRRRWRLLDRGSILALGAMSHASPVWASACKEKSWPSTTRPRC